MNEDTVKLFLSKTPSAVVVLIYFVESRAYNEPRSIVEAYYAKRAADEEIFGGQRYLMEQPLEEAPYYVDPKIIASDWAVTMAWERRSNTDLPFSRYSDGFEQYKVSLPHLSRALLEWPQLLDLIIRDTKASGLPGELKTCSRLFKEALTIETIG